MWAENFHVYKLDLEKAMENGTRDQIADNCWIIEKEKKKSKNHLLLLPWLV